MAHPYKERGRIKSDFLTSASYFVVNESNHVLAEEIKVSYFSFFFISKHNFITPCITDVILQLIFLIST